MSASQEDAEARIYLAGPVQHAADGGHGWRNRVADEHDVDGIEWVDPLAKYDTTLDDVIVHKGTPPEDPPEESEVISVTELVDADKRMIRTSDAILVHWQDVKTAGTPMEMLYAHRLDKTVVVWNEVDALPWWIEHHADAVYESLDKCVTYLRGAVDR